MSTPRPTRASLATLVRQAQSGDAEALAALARQALADARRAARRAVADEHAAEDIAQDALLSAWLNLGSLQEPRAFGAWLRHIVRRHAYRWLRQRDVALLPMDRFIGAANDPVHHADRSQRHAALHAALAHLPAQWRDVAGLFYLRQCSQREVAAFLDLPLTTVNNRLHKARRLLKERMLAMPHERPDEHAPHDERPRPPHGSASSTPHTIGTVTGVAGPAIAVRFEEGASANVLDALAVPDEHGRLVEALKVAQRRDGRNVLALPTGPAEPPATGAKVLNVREVAVDAGFHNWMIPAMAEDEVRQLARHDRRSASDLELLETGIKSIDLFCPLPRHGTVAMIAPAGAGRLALIDELAHRLHERDDVTLGLFSVLGRRELEDVRAMVAPGKGYRGDVTGGVAVTWILADQMPDADYAEALATFDGAVYLSPVVGMQQGWPSVDALASRSRLLEPATVGRRHAQLAERARALLRQTRTLMIDPVLLELLACQSIRKASERARTEPAQRLAKLEPNDRQRAARGLRLQAFLPQPLFTAEPFTALARRSVALNQTLAGVEAILDGECDDVSEQALRYIGGLDERRAAG